MGSEKDEELNSVLPGGSLLPKGTDGVSERKLGRVPAKMWRGRGTPAGPGELSPRGLRFPPAASSRRFGGGALRTGALT